MNETPRIDRVILHDLHNTFLPGIEQVEEGRLGDGTDYYWALCEDGHAGAERTVWIVPAEKRYGLPYLSNWISAKRKDRWIELEKAYGQGRLGECAGVFLLRVPPPPSGHWTRMGWPNSIPPFAVCYIGELRRGQKVTAGLIQRETALAAMVVKFPVSEMARARIRAEAETIERLQRDIPGVAPRLIAFDENNCILIEEALPGVSAGPLLEPHHLPFLTRLAATGKTTTLQRQLGNLHERLALINDMDSETRLLVDEVSARLDSDKQIPAVWVHSDLHAGNLVLRKNGAVQAIDWGSAYNGGLPFYDIVRTGLINFLDGNRVRTELQDVGEAHRAYARALDIDIGLFDRVVAYYLASHMLSRYASKPETVPQTRTLLRNCLKKIG